MNRNRFYRFNVQLVFLLMTIGSVPAQENLIEPLQPLARYVGKTWRGNLTEATPDKPMVDVSRWERALNGQAIRILHSVNDGEYGGETLILWDAEKEDLIFYYFTTAGFYTQGTIKIEGDTFTSHELVTGNSDGITEVRATGRLLPDGRMHSKAQYLKNGEWTDGHEIWYVEDAQARVVFR